jgi:hypothetical protein
MELVRPIAAIRRRWKLLLAGAVVAIALAVALGKPPTGSSAVAWTRVTLDTPKSQVVESDPRGADSLPWRAALMVHLMSTDESVRELARRVGVRPEDVAVVDPALAEPQVPASMPAGAAEAASFTVAPYVLTIYVRVTQLPMINIEAAAPDRDGAKRLAEAAVDIFEGESSPTETPYTSRILTGGGAALKYQTYVIEAVAPVRSKEILSGGSPTKQISVLMLFGAWCAAVLLLPPLLRRRVRGPLPA